MPVQLAPEDDATLTDYGVGLTDLTKTKAQSHDHGLMGHYDLPSFIAKMAKYQPKVVAFTSKKAASDFAVASGLRRPSTGSWGALPWTVADRPAFVLPGPSGSNNAMSVPRRVALWSDLARFIETA